MPYGTRGPGTVVSRGGAGLHLDIKKRDFAVTEVKYLEFIVQENCDYPGVGAVDEGERGTEFPGVRELLP